MKRNSLARRQEKSFATKDRGAGNVPAFDWKKAKHEVVFFKPKEGKLRFDIIPYKIKSKNHPLVRQGDAEVGELDYLFDMYIHPRVGPGYVDVICPKRNFNKPCPVCEQMQEYKDQGKDKEANLLKAKRTVFYNILDSRDRDKGIQVFSVSHFLFEKELIEEARASSDPDTPLIFADIDNGKTIVCRAATETFMGESGKGNDYLVYKNFSFVDREEALDEDLIDEAVSFDECMKLPSYDEIQEILFGKDEDDQEETEKEEEKEEKDDDDDEPEPEEKPKTKVKEKANKKDEEGENPKSSKKPKVEDDDEKPKVKGMKDCPKGHKYGYDCDKFSKDCDPCPIWEPCADMQNKLKKEDK